MTTTTTTTTLNNHTKKKNKKYKPFRVKLSSIVAIRYNKSNVAIRYNKSSLPTIISSSSSSSLLWNETWLHPLPGRDCNYNLIGKYIRCIFPKRIITMMMINEKQLHKQNKEIGIKERFLEGEIIELVSIRSNDNNNGIPVKLLIDKKYISTMPFLKHYQIKEEREKKEDDSNNNTTNNTNNETKMQMYEERIRGKNKVIIELILANGDSNHNNINQNSNCPLQQAKQKHVKWLIRKWIPKTNNNNNNNINNNNTNAMIEEIGNDYDTNSQKERNFRWYHTMLQYNNNHNNNNNHHHHHEYYKIGQVIKMDVNNENLNTTNDDHGGNKNGKGIKRKRDLLNNSSSSSSLAMVTVKEMILPEVTHSGRLAHHHLKELFDLDDNNYCESNTNDKNTTTRTFQVPIEDLIVLGRKVHRLENNNSETEIVERIEKLNNIDSSDFFVRYKYNVQQDIFHPIDCKDGTDSDLEYKVCHYCRRNMKRSSTIQCSKMHSSNLDDNKRTDSQSWCNECCQMFNTLIPQSLAKETEWVGPCCLGICDCSQCNRKPFRKSFQEHICKWVISDNIQRQVEVNNSSSCSLLQMTKALLDTAPPCDFELPFNIDDIIASPGVNPRKSSTGSPKAQRKLPQASSTEHGVSETDDKIDNMDQKDNSVEDKKFQPTCARCKSYDSFARGVRQANNSAAHAAQAVASVRSGGKKSDHLEENEGSKVTASKSSGRAARASQRRRNKGYEGLGLGLINDVRGREDVLRFGKSLIHGWGVFTDGQIREGDLIVEYRGILIGNAVADKREKEYEKAKIGSDYMFRIDSETVCDATHHGCVARFINASCTPNCYTQIITLNGTKRIAIYAKRDIMPGEELYYDYKFALEFDEAKRIRKFQHVVIYIAFPYYPL